MPACVADTSPLIALSSIQRLDLLRIVFDQALIVPAVFAEVVTQGVGWRQAQQLQDEIRAGVWVHRCAATSSALERELREGLGGSGEAEVIALAVERRLPVLLDELAGRRAAVALGLKVVGSLGVLRQAKAGGHLERIRPLTEAMVEAGIYFHDSLLERFYREVGEA